jgi:hypothetical protein
MRQPLGAGHAVKLESTTGVVVSRRMRIPWIFHPMGNAPRIAPAPIPFLL